MRLFVVSTSANTDRILDQIKASGVTVALHIGDVTADFKASSLSRLTTRRGRLGHLMDAQRFSGAARALMLDPNHPALMEEFIDHLHRTGPLNTHRAHQLTGMQDYFDYYHILADVMAERMIAAGVTHCVFFNIPHLSYDSMAFQVAQALNLPCVIVTQSLFPNRYFSMANPRDMGDFTPDGRAAPYPMQRGEKPDLFYMKGIKQEREEGGTVSKKGFLQFLAYLALKRPRQALNPAYVIRLYRHMQKTYAAFPKWRDPFARFFHADNLAYFDHLAQFEDTPVDLTGDFIYVPLQLQPEMTTSSLGDAFRDQALAIEWLAGLVPEGVRILVKENPKQHSAHMRGPMFFHRLKRIPSVTFLPSWANSAALTDHAVFVATITGTVGWEAVRSGKPALVFGRAWYRRLPGVVEYREGLTYAEILAATPDHDALQQAAGDLLARTHPGVVDRHYTKLVPDFDVVANDNAVASTIIGLLTGTANFTFPPKVAP